MSLKAKLEAVIYAAEEPVTLAQLAALFAADALDWKAAQQAVPAAQGDPAGEAPPLLNAEFDYQQMEQPTESNQSFEQLAQADSPSAVTEAADAIAKAEMPVDEEAEAKRLTRSRDREVRGILRGLLDELIATYASDDRGIEIKEIAGGYRMATKPECHDAARLFVKSLKPAFKLSLPALETLAVIAYKQPVTAPEVNEIRGVDSSGVFGSLLARKLIATAGRKQVIGRPILYKTTKEFLLRFGLKDVTELPSMEEFEKMAQLEFEDMQPAFGESGPAEDAPETPEVDDEPDDPESDSRGSSAGTGEEMKNGPRREGHATDVKSDSEEASEQQTPESPEPVADLPAIEAETPSGEAAPAAPTPLEQAETETVPHD
jgi:segregation and condensation protein B